MTIKLSAESTWAQNADVTVRIEFGDAVLSIPLSIEQCQPFINRLVDATIESIKQQEAYMQSLMDKKV